MHLPASVSHVPFICCGPLDRSDAPCARVVVVVSPSRPYHDDLSGLLHDTGSTLKPVPQVVSVRPSTCCVSLPLDRGPFPELLSRLYTVTMPEGRGGGIAYIERAD